MCLVSERISENLLIYCGFTKILEMFIRPFVYRARQSDIMMKSTMTKDEDG